MCRSMVGNIYNFFVRVFRRTHSCFYSFHFLFRSCPFLPAVSIPLPPICFCSVEPSGVGTSGLHFAGSSSSTSFTSSRSLTNYAEAQAVSECVSILLTKGVRASEIGVISLFRAQVSLIKQHLLRADMEISSRFAASNSSSTVSNFDEYYAHDPHWNGQLPLGDGQNPSKPRSAYDSFARKRFLADAWRNHLEGSKTDSERTDTCTDSTSQYIHDTQTKATTVFSKDGEYNPSSVMVSTIDAFQGGERNIIILSCCQQTPMHGASGNSNIPGASRGSGFDDEVAFVENPNRICVALSRAKNHLIIFGNENALCSTTPLASTHQLQLQHPRYQQNPWDAVVTSAKTFTRGFHLTPSSFLGMIRESQYFGCDMSQATQFFEYQ